MSMCIFILRCRVRRHIHIQLFHNLITFRKYIPSLTILESSRNVTITNDIIIIYSISNSYMNINMYSIYENEWSRFGYFVSKINQSH